MLSCGLAISDVLGVRFLVVLVEPGTVIVILNLVVQLRIVELGVIPVLLPHVIKLIDHGSFLNVLHDDVRDRDSEVVSARSAEP